MSNDITIGKAYFNNNEGMHLFRYSEKETNKEIEGFTLRTRIAYIIISDDESKDLNKNIKDKETILKNVKNKYKEHLIKAIKQESEKLTLPLLKAGEEKVIDKKLIKLSSLNLYLTGSYGNVLSLKKYNYAYKNLEKSLKEESDKKSIGTLSFSKKSCQQILKDEKTNLENQQAYIIVSMPYVYNIKKDSKIEELELTLYEDNTIASFMPELIVEYGIFFDGTGNNIYNIDFYRNFTEFLKEPAEFIEENKNFLFEPKTRTEDYKTIQEYIVSEPNPKLNEQILVVLLNQINSAKKPIRYFDKESNLALEEKELLTSEKAKHARKVFDYLLEVKKEANNSEEKSRADFVRKNILADDDEDSSYVNGESNISRLYKLYDADDVRNSIDVPSTTRFKLYESGAGTYNPFVSSDYGKDSVWGLGLAIGETGVKAHIVYSCMKIAQQLRESSISHIGELVLDVFGFSRGAATAREFVCSILKESDILKNSKREYTITMKDDKDIFYPFFKDKGYVNIGGDLFFNPLRVDIEKGRLGKKEINNPYYKKAKITIDSISFRFAGLYDTVPHYGLTQGDDNEDLNLDFFENENDKKIGQVVHLMADDEYRFNFDAYSIFPTVNKNFRKADKRLSKGGYKFEEYYLPGAHSDVGGGYNLQDEVILITKAIIPYPKIPSRFKHNIKAWNKKYNWLESSDIIEEVKNKDDIKDLNKDGFYYTIKSLPSSNNNKSYKLRIYMYKTQISNKYEYLSLKLMHSRAIHQDGTEELVDKRNTNPFERVPFGSINSYSFSDEQTLTEVYKVLKQNREVKNHNKDIYKRLKNDYIHHSSKNDSFVNRASNVDKEDNDFYGKRVIYSSRGERFTRG